MLTQTSFEELKDKVQSLVNEINKILSKNPSISPPEEARHDTLL